MQRSPHLNRQVRKPTTIPHHPANPSRGSAPRRSQRLLLQKTSNYSSSDDFSGRDVVRNIRAEVFRAAAIFDLISCGNHPDPRTAMRSGERKRVLDDDGEEGEVFELVPKENWVFSTPTQQRIERPKPKESQMVPALLHTTSKYKTLYEMGEGPSAKIMRQNVVESDVGCFRRMARFHINHGEALLQTSLVTEKENWKKVASTAPPEQFMPSPPADPFHPPSRHATRRILFNEEVPSSSALPHR